MWYTKIYSNIIEYQKYIGTSIKVGLLRVKTSHNLVQVQHVYIQDNTFYLIRSCGKDVYKVEKSKEDT